jgi:hypothetical protein
MAQAVSRRVRSLVSPFGIFGGQSGAGTSIFPCQFHSTGAPLHGNSEKETNNLHHRVAQ